MKKVRNIQISKKSSGGMLTGPSHEQGGIPVIVDGTEPIEVEGGEFIINKQTVDALGEDFLHTLNSTQTTHHTGGFTEGQLPSPSKFRRGGRINKKPVRRMATGGRARMAKGKRTRPVPRGRGRKMGSGGHSSMNNCGKPGFPPCGSTAVGGGYRRGGKTGVRGRTTPVSKTSRGRKMAGGGAARSRRMGNGGTFTGGGKAQKDCLGGKMYQGHCWPLAKNNRHNRQIATATAGRCPAGTYRVLGGACMETSW